MSYFKFLPQKPSLHCYYVYTIISNGFIGICSVFETEQDSIGCQARFPKRIICNQDYCCKNCIIKIKTKLFSQKSLRVVDNFKIFKKNYCHALNFLQLQINESISIYWIRFTKCCYLIYCLLQYCSKRKVLLDSFRSNVFTYLVFYPPSPKQYIQV